MKVYVLEDFEGSIENIFTTKRLAELYVKRLKEESPYNLEYVISEWGVESELSEELSGDKGDENPKDP